MMIEEKYQKCIDFIKSKTRPKLSDQSLQWKMDNEYDNCDYCLAFDCRKLLEEIGELDDV